MITFSSYVNVFATTVLFRPDLCFLLMSSSDMILEQGFLKVF